MRLRVPIGKTHGQRTTVMIGRSKFSRDEAFKPWKPMFNRDELYFNIVRSIKDLSACGRRTAGFCQGERFNHGKFVQQKAHYTAVDDIVLIGSEGDNVNFQPKYKPKTDKATYGGLSKPSELRRPSILVSGRQP